MEGASPPSDVPEIQTEDQLQKKPRKKPWIASEELLLIQEVLANEELLFGDLKGHHTGGKSIGKRRAEAWTEIAQKITSQCVQTRRDPDDAKKKYFNLKQRAKEKIDIQRKMRQKTGGGPAPPQLSASEEALVDSLGDRPGIQGLSCGVDTDALDTNVNTVTDTDNVTEDASLISIGQKRKDGSNEIESNTESSGRKRRRPNGHEQELETLKNTKLDTERIILEKDKTNLEIEKLKCEINCLKMKEDTYKYVKDMAETINLYYQQRLGLNVFGESFGLVTDRET